MIFAHVSEVSYKFVGVLGGYCEARDRADVAWVGLVHHREGGDLSCEEREELGCTLGTNPAGGGWIPVG